MQHNPTKLAPGAFTLIELLVVVTIIVVLLALLVPAMDKAIYQAEKALCLTQQKNMVNACIIYATEQKKYFPPNSLPGKGSATAYDIRMWLDDNGNPTPYAVNPGTGAGPVSPNLQLGLLPDGGYLPKDRLGKIMHCPVMDNTGSPNSSFGTGAGKYAGVGMDVINDFGVGAGLYNDPNYDALRVIIGYHYRAASWEKTGKGKMRMGSHGSDFLMTVDMPDQRFAGLTFGPGTVPEDRKADTRAFSHWDGYGVSFADGHVSFRDDLDYEIAWKVIYNGDNGGGYGVMAASTPGEAAFAEYVYTQFMNRDR